MALSLKKIFQGDPRSVKAKKNIVVSFGLKGIDILVYFLLVPATLGYLNSYEYGIWLTLNSILMWINSFDIGLGNGLRNKLAEALAKDDRQLCRSYVSTAFFMLSFIMITLIILGSCLFKFLNWYDILSVSPDTVSRLDQIVYISFVLFCFNFILKIIGNVYLALQMTAVNNLLTVSGHVLSLVIIYLLTLTTKGSLLWVAIVYSISPIIIYLISYPVTFLGKYKYMAPSIRYFEKRYLKDLFNMGILFFISQLGSLLLFSTTNLIISHQFGPENVTPYNISQRYFSAITLCFNLIIAPMWAATTDAYTRGDTDWIKRAMRRIKKILSLILIGLVIMIIASKIVYRIWIGDKVTISIAMTTLMAIYTFILVWSLGYSYFLNGMGKLTLQAINTIIVGVCFIPLGIICGNLFGLYGVIIALCIANLSGAILNTIQYNKVMKGNACGIWQK